MHCHSDARSPSYRLDASRLKLRMKSLREKCKDIYAVAMAIVFHAPNKRFDEIVGSDEVPYTDPAGRVAAVTEAVTARGGMVRYSGCNWRARLGENGSNDRINVGEEVTIESSEGNVLLVKPRESRVD